MVAAGALCLAALPGRAQILDRAWARHAPRCSSYTVAPDGAVVVASDSDGHVQSLDASGRVLWRLKFQREVRCASASGGALVAAYARDDPAYRRVHLVDGRGRIVRTETAPGPVRSVAVSEDGRVVAILSEPARLTIVERRPGGWKWRRAALAGPVASLSTDAAGERLAVALRDPADVLAMDRRLRVLWRWKGTPGTLYRVQMDRAGRAIVGTGIPSEGVARALYWSVDHREPVWSHTLRGDLARVAMAPDGSCVAASYRTRLWHRRSSVVERHVALFSPAGKMLWEVGGLMFGANLVGPSAAPLLMLTHDGNRVLAALDGYGHMRARHRLASPIRSTAISTDGTHFAVLTDGQVLYLFRTRR